ncbi:MAG: histidinol-phosphate transaminase [Alphaproteobacteria bacterium]
MSVLIPRPGILQIDPYVGGRSTIEGVEKVIKLSSNESALGPSPKAVAAFRASAESLARYPDGGVRRLREALGAHHGLDPERIVCGNGSDELIELLVRAYVGSGDEVLFTEHSFLIFWLVTLGVGAAPVTAPEKDLKADIDALLNRVSDRTRIVFLANPNNPTGSYVSRDEISRLREALREDVLLVIDGAYAEFVTRADYSSGFEFVDQDENTVVIGTFSKIHGLATLRLGWAYCPASIADVLNRLRAPFNVSGPTQAAGVAALQDEAHMEEVRRHTETWREWLTREIAGLGLKVYPSVCNFILVRFSSATSAEAADAFLSSKGIIVRSVARYGLADCLRITIGQEDEMRAVAHALAEALVRETLSDG